MHLETAITKDQQPLSKATAVSPPSFAQSSEKSESGVRPRKRDEQVAIDTSSDGPQTNAPQTTKTETDETDVTLEPILDGQNSVETLIETPWALIGQLSVASISSSVQTQPSVPQTLSVAENPSEDGAQDASVSKGETVGRLSVEVSQAQLLPNYVQQTEPPRWREPYLWDVPNSAGAMIVYYWYKLKALFDELMSQPCLLLSSWYTSRNLPAR